jgi:phosphomannomutase
MTDLLDRARAWIAADPDSNTRDELERVVADATQHADTTLQNKALRDLSERFAGPLEFGTAGLRGVMGAGESRMNQAVIRRTTAGLVRYLLTNSEPAALKRGVVIGYDGRHQSFDFAKETASVLAAAGVHSFLAPEVCPTPYAAFAVDALRAAAGVMITASHNPPKYNGYKAYWSNGAQIIPPQDEGIAAAIDTCPAAKDIPVMGFDEARAIGWVKFFPDGLLDDYMAKIDKLWVRPFAKTDLRIVYTPMHGVGEKCMRIAMTRAGFGGYTTVPEQEKPDGDFPTVAFPNPEEKGAMDLSFALAEKQRADLVLANDPDADRLAVAVPRPGGGYLQLTGNQVGTLLGHYLLTTSPACLSAQTSVQDAHTKIVIASIVSSPMLGAIARTLGVRYEETLTGFKWIANRAMELEKSEQLKFVFGYEEALGYTVGSLVRDKDGISAGVLFAEFAALLKENGRTVLDELESLSRRYGHYASGQVSVTLPGADGMALMKTAMDRVRAARPTRIGPLAVLAQADFQSGIRTHADGRTQSLTLPVTNMITLDLEGGSRIIARPSGTEPKIKFYFDVREPMSTDETMQAADARASARMSELMKAFRELAGV